MARTLHIHVYITLQKPKNLRASNLVKLLTPANILSIDTKNMACKTIVHNQHQDLKTNLSIFLLVSFQDYVTQDYLYL